MKVLKLIAIGTVFNLTACSSIEDTQESAKKNYNVVSKGSSVFDGSKFVRVNNIFCHDVLFNLEYNSRTHVSKSVILTAIAPLAKNIEKKDSLLFNLDKEISVHSSRDNITNIETVYNGYSAGNISSKKYVVPLSFIERITNAKQVTTKLNLLGGTYVEGYCSPITIDQAKSQYEGSGLGVQHFTQETIDFSNQVAGVIGFKSFVELVKSTQW